CGDQKRGVDDTSRGFEAVDLGDDVANDVGHREKEEPAVGEQWTNLHAFCRANIRQDKNHGHDGEEHWINMGANWCERSLKLSFGMWCFSHEASLDKNVVSRRCHGLNGPVHSCCPSRRHSS